MAQIGGTLNIADEQKAQEMLDAFCAEYGFDPASGLTQRQFFKEKVKEFFRAPWLKQRRRVLDEKRDVALTQEANSVTIT